MISSKTLHTQGTTTTKTKRNCEKGDGTERKGSGGGRRLFASAERGWITARRCRWEAEAEAKPSGRQPPTPTGTSSQQMGRHREADPGPGAATADDRVTGKGRCAGRRRPTRSDSRVSPHSTHAHHMNIAASTGRSGERDRVRRPSRGVTDWWSEERPTASNPLFARLELVEREKNTVDRLVVGN